MSFHDDEVCHKLTFLISLFTHGIFWYVMTQYKEIDGVLPTSICFMVMALALTFFNWICFRPSSYSASKMKCNPTPEKYVAMGMYQFERRDLKAYHPNELPVSLMVWPTECLLYRTPISTIIESSDTWNVTIWCDQIQYIIWWMTWLPVSWYHKNIERHTVATTVPWPNPKQWVIVHTSDLMTIIRQVYIFSQSSQEKWVNWKHTAPHIVYWITERICLILLTH